MNKLFNEINRQNKKSGYPELKQLSQKQTALLISKGKTDSMKKALTLLWQPKQFIKKVGK